MDLNAEAWRMKRHEMFHCDFCGHLILSLVERENYNGFERLCKCPVTDLPEGVEWIPPSLRNWNCRDCGEENSPRVMACGKCRGLKIE